MTYGNVENLVPGGKPKKFSYTQDDLVKLTGLSKRTLKSYECAGKFKRGDIVSLFRYLLRKQCSKCLLRKEDG